MKNPVQSSFDDNVCERCTLVWDCRRCRDEQRNELSELSKPCIDVELDVVRASVSDVVERHRPPADDLHDLALAGRLRHIANALFGAVEQSIGDLLTDDDDSAEDEMFRATLVLVTSCWRIADAAERGRLVVRWDELSPVLLLIDELLRVVDGMRPSVAANIGLRQREWIEETLSELRRIAGVFIERVDARSRTQLERLIEVGGAPSPFCQVQPNWFSRIDARDWATRVITRARKAPP